MGISGRSSCTAYAGMRRIAAGPLTKVAPAARERFESDPTVQVLVFDDVTGEQVDLDFGVSGAELVERLARAGDAATSTPADGEPSGTAPRGPGPPRLGVVAREVTRLPRHWEGLGSQPGGASVALRKLVEQARKANEGKDLQRHAQEAAYRFMSAMAGSLAGFEEAIRALFAADRARFDEMVVPWPADVRDYAGKLAAGAFAGTLE